MNNIQKNLDSLYDSYLDSILGNADIVEGISSSKYSSPLFISLDVKNGYIKDKKYKMLYVGQQTNGWFDKKDWNGLNINNHKDYREALKTLYYEFNFGDRLYGKKYSGYLWQFQQLLTAKINDENQNNCGIIWSNLVRLDENLNKINENDMLEKIAINNNEILRKEIEIIQPDIVVFVTGYSYDWLLKKTFNDIQFHQSDNGNLNINKLAILQSEFLPKYSFRTYHPRALYQNRYLRSSRNIIIETIAEEVKLS